MELWISKSGIKESIEYVFNDIDNSLKKAMSTATNPPSSFRYANYVRDLDQKINQFIKENNSIETSITQADKDYDDEWNEQIRKFSIIEENIIDKRNGFNI